MMVLDNEESAGPFDDFFFEGDFADLGAIDERKDFEKNRVQRKIYRAWRIVIEHKEGTIYFEINL